MQTHPPLERQDPPRRAVAEVALVLVVAAAAAVLTLAVTREPTRVARVTVENPTPWELHAVLGDGSDGGWTPLPVLRPRTRTEVPDVIDPGARWVLRITGPGGATTGRVVALRRDLQAAGWELALPASVAADLRRQGVPTTPP